MAGKIIDLLRVSVTDGDALAANRLKGKSNTGTYFVCSSKDWSSYKKFFTPGIRYFIDLGKVAVYKESFLKLVYESEHEKYPDKMNSFADTCNSLLSWGSNPETFIELRNNDVRVFMHFENNNGECERLFRGILYSQISTITLELRGNRCMVYPEIEKPNVFIEENIDYVYEN